VGILRDFYKGYTLWVLGLHRIRNMLNLGDLKPEIGGFYRGY
jgi:hypothetical protein